MLTAHLGDNGLENAGDFGFLIITEVESEVHQPHNDTDRVLLEGAIFREGEAGGQDTNGKQGNEK